eukprot:XP_025001427.1 Sjoegren syndrome/scleroderma autoantigen 1 [Gallus gallus]
MALNAGTDPDLGGGRRRRRGGSGRSGSAVRWGSTCCGGTACWGAAAPSARPSFCRTGSSSSTVSPARSWSAPPTPSLPPRRPAPQTLRRGGSSGGAPPPPPPHLLPAPHPAPPHPYHIPAAVAAAEAAVLGKLRWAAQELPPHPTAEGSAQLCVLIRSCAEALRALRGLGVTPPTPTPQTGAPPRRRSHKGFRPPVPP